MNKEKILKYLVENTCYCLMVCSCGNNYYEIIEKIENGEVDND